jgi:endonuclease YncB( thermonuclease family)
MVQKILIFKIIFFIFLFNNNLIYAETIIGIATVIDGDTINIDNNKIRLHGIDAPERKQTCLDEDKNWECGKQSTFELKKIINDQNVKCRITDIDQYKRYVAICYINDLNINQTMVRKGWAIAYRYYSDAFIKDEDYARKNKAGIWKSIFEEPYKFRKKNK